jgi:hypothetical protein
VLPNTVILSLDKRELGWMSARVQGLLPWAAAAAPPAPLAPAARPFPQADPAAELHRYLQGVRSAGAGLVSAADRAADWLAAVGRNPPGDAELQAAVEAALTQSLGVRVAQQLRI